MARNSRKIAILLLLFILIQTIFKRENCLREFGSHILTLTQSKHLCSWQPKSRIVKGGNFLMKSLQQLIWMRYLDLVDLDAAQSGPAQRVLIVLMVGFELITP